MSSTSNNANYTPTMAALPWHIGTDSHVYDANGHFVTVSGFHFTVAGGDYIPVRLSTEFIVRACNAHYEMRDLLEEAAKRVREDPVGDHELADRIEAKLAALAAAEA